MVYKVVGFILIFGLYQVFCQTDWVSLARLVDRDGYALKLIGETVASMEDYEWCNFKIKNFNQTLNQRIYNWQVVGTVEYNNGFLTGVESISVTDISHSISKLSSSNTTQASVGGILQLNGPRIGFDVAATLTDQPTQHSTGVYAYDYIKIQFYVAYNFNTQIYSVSTYVENLQVSDSIMVFLPSTNLTEVISRVYTPFNIFDSVSDWATDIITPMILDAAQNKVPFPEVCFSC